MLFIPGYYREKIQPKLSWLVKKFGNSFLLYYKPGIVKTAQSMNQAFNLPPIDYQNYFAYKALPNPHVAKFLHEEAGFGFDCSSPSEKMGSRFIGVLPEDIMYTSNRTSAAEFTFALSDGGCLINFDDITALDRVKGPFPKTVCFRINPGKRRTGNSIIGDPYNAKYGITYDQIIPAYRKAMKRGATEFGVHMMVCSNERRSGYIVETARAILEVAALLERKLGIRVKFVNIGGGFGIPYKPGDRELNLVWIATRIRNLFEDFEKSHGFVPRLLTECGRYVTGPHGFLVNRVVSVEQKYRHFIGVEAAMAGCPRPAFYGAYHHIEVYSPEGELRTGPCHFVYVAGPQCEGWDMLTPVGHPRRLSKSVKEGDILVTFSCGAHSGAMAGNYNGRPRLPEVLIENENCRNTHLIRRAETTEDLFRTVTPFLK